MATFYGANNTEYYQTVPAQKIAPGKQDARIFVSSDTYALAAAFTTADTVEMMVLPKGAIILDIVFESPNMSTTGIFTVGTAADTDGYLVGLDAGGQAVRGNIITHGTGALAPFQAELAADTTVVVGCSENTTATSGTIKLSVFYTLE